MPVAIIVVVAEAVVVEKGEKGVAAADCKNLGKKN